MVSFIQRAGVVTAMVGLLQALPGTKLQARMRREGPSARRGTGDNVNGRQTSSLAWASRLSISGYRSVLTEALFGPKVLPPGGGRFLSEFCEGAGRHHPAACRGCATFRALLGSMVVLGVFGKERFELLETDALGSGVSAMDVSARGEVAIMGYHFVAPAISTSLERVPLAPNNFRLGFRERGRAAAWTGPKHQLLLARLGHARHNGRRQGLPSSSAGLR